MKVDQAQVNQFAVCLDNQCKAFPLWSRVQGKRSRFRVFRVRWGLLGSRVKNRVGMKGKYLSSLSDCRL